MTKMICATCNHQGEPKTITKGSFLIEFILWIFTWPLCSIPGLVYSIWRLVSRYKGCAACGSASIIPLNTPIGKKLVKRSKTRG